MNDVFISYSRKDQAFVKKLFDALTDQKRETWVDWEGIPPTAEWLAEVYAAIDAANAFIYVISPDSTSSEICQLELKHAINQNKRLIPVLLKEVDPGKLHEQVSKINWLRMDEDNVYSSLNNLLAALDTDLDWVKDHTRLTVRASEWDQHDRDDSRLFRGKNLESAEQWFAAAPDKSLDPTSLQSLYITASRQVSNKRQRRLLSGITAGLIVAIGLAIFAWLQRNTAIEEATRAKSSLLSSQAVLALDNDRDPTRGFQYAAAAWKLNPSNSTAKSLMLRSQYGEKTFSYQGNRYRPPMYRNINTDIDFISTHLSPDDEHIAVISYPPDASESEINILDPEGEVIGIVNGQFKMFSDDGQYFATIEYESKTGSIWDLGGELVVKDKAYFKVLNQLTGTFKIEEEKLTSIPHDPKIVSMRVKTLEKIKPWTFVEGDPGIELDVSYSRDQQLIAAYDQKHTYRVWNYKGNLVATFPKQKALITSADFSPDRQYLAVSYSSGDLAIWSLKTNKNKDLNDFENKLITLRGHTDTARSVEFTQDGKRLLSTARDGRILIWDLQAFPVPILKTATNITFHPEQDRIISSTYSSTSISDYEGNNLNSIEGYFTKGLINSVAISPDRKSAAAIKDKNLHIYSLDNDTSLDTKAHDNNILSVAFSLSGKRIVTTDLTSIKVWDLEANLITSVDVKLGEGSVYSNMWKPYLVDTAGDDYFLVQTDKNIRLLDMKGNEIKTLAGKSGSGMMDKEMFSSDLRYMIITGGEHRLSIFDLESMELIAYTEEFPEHENFQIARFAPDTHQVFAAIEFRGQVYLWDWKIEKMQQFDASYQLESAQVVPNLDRVITKSIDGMIRFWDLSGKELFVIKNQTSAWVKLSPEGKYLALANQNEEGWPVELWSFDPDQLSEQIIQIGIPEVEYQ